MLSSFFFLSFYLLLSLLFWFHRRLHSFLANVHVRYVVVRLQLSVCCLSSVCNVRAHCTLLRRLRFSAMFLCHLVCWPSVDIQVKFYGDRPRESPPSGELNTRGVADRFWTHWTLSRKCCKIGAKLVLITSITPEAN